MMSRLLKIYDRSRVPLYIQVASEMRRRVETGRWLPGERISTLIELEREFQVARVTIRQAVEILREEGLLTCQQGRGTFVAKGPRDRHWLTLETEWDVLVNSIKDNVPRRINVEDAPAFPDLRDGEGKRASSYVYLRSLQFKEGEPYALVSLHLARRIFELDPDAFETRTALPVLAQLPGAAIRHAHQTLVIGSADPETADRLNIALGAPIAECRCVVIDENEAAIYVADITYRSDVIKLRIDLLATSRKPAKRTRSNAALNRRPALSAP